MNSRCSHTGIRRAFYRPESRRTGRRIIQPSAAPLPARLKTTGFEPGKRKQDSQGATMIRYVAAAVALKAFSSGPAMRGLYRSLGNVVGARRRLRHGLHRNHLNRAQDFLRTVRRFDAIHDGDTLLELGTGWVHWEST